MATSGLRQPSCVHRIGFGFGGCTWRESLTIGGRPARHVQKTGREAARFFQFVVVHVRPGWLLTVESWTITATRRGQHPPAPTRPDLIEAATRTRVRLSTTGWIG